MWKRDLDLWYNMHKEAGQRTLGGLLVRALQGEAKSHIYARLSEDEISSETAYTVVTNILEGRYGQDEMIERFDLKREFSEFRRGGMDLEVFINRYDAMRTKCLRFGRVKSAELDARSGTCG